MQINSQDVKALREKTGAGMMDCKQALVEAKGNAAEAEKILRKKGIAVAGKKAARSAKDGCIASYIHHGSKLGVFGLDYGVPIQTGSNPLNGKVHFSLQTEF